MHRHRTWQKRRRARCLQPQATPEPEVYLLEILEVRVFPESELPGSLSHGMTDMLKNSLAARRFWE